MKINELYIEAKRHGLFLSEVPEDPQSIRLSMGLSQSFIVDRQLLFDEPSAILSDTKKTIIADMIRYLTKLANVNLTDNSDE